MKDITLTSNEAPEQGFIRLIFLSIIIFSLLQIFWNKSLEAQK